jgi:CheY-like chemotaxis protein
MKPMHTVLVVDGNSGNRIFFADRFRTSLGYRVEVAEDPFEAMCKISDFRYDLILWSESSAHADVLKVIRTLNHGLAMDAASPYQQSIEKTAVIVSSQKAPGFLRGLGRRRVRSDYFYTLGTVSTEFGLSECWNEILEALGYTPHVHIEVGQRPVAIGAI